MDFSVFALTGDVDAITSSANRWSMFSTATRTASDDIRRIDSGGFEGDEADLYHQRINGDLPPHLDATSSAWHTVSAALKTYAATLDGLQSRMTGLAARAGEQQSEAEVAGGVLADAQTSDVRHAESVEKEEQALPPGQNPPADAYRSQSADASRAASAANAQLQSTVDAANRVRHEHAAAVDTCVDAINRAAGTRFEEPPGFWGRLKDSVVGWIKDHADALLAISSVLKQISAIAGLLAMIPVLAPIMGPLAAATGGVALAIDTTVYAATGQGSLTDILIDGAGMLPFGKGLQMLKDGAKAGENAAKETRVAANAIDDGKNARGALSETGSGATGRVSEGSGNASNSRTPVENRKCVGDPIDVVTGEMIMAQTDLTLPGVLPLVLRRVHLSSYRWGTLFGRTWASTLDQRVEIGPDGSTCFVAEDGVVLCYPGAETARVGDAVLPIEGIQRWPLRRLPDGTRTVEDPDNGVIRSFGRPDRGGRCQIQEISDRYGNTIFFDYDARQFICGVRHSGGYRIDIDVVAGRVAGISVHDHSKVVPVTAFEYDTTGDLLRVNSSADEALRFQYDDAGRIVQWTDRNGIWYRYEYDADGRCARTSGRGRVLSYGFCYLPGRTLVTDSLGSISAYEYNESGQVIREIDALGNMTASVWDRRDRLLLRTDPMGRSTQLRYDAAGRLIKVILPDGRSETL